MIFVRLEGKVRIGAEIDELAWLDLDAEAPLTLTPLVRVYAVPLARAARASAPATR